MSLNKVMLIGNVGRDPEIRYIEAGVATATLSLATTTPGYTLPSGTQVPERTEWHRVLMFRRLAEIVERYVHKGDKLFVEGSLRTRSYTDKLGKTKYVTEIWAENMEMLTPRSTAQGGVANAGAQANAQESQQANNDNKCPF